MDVTVEVRPRPGTDGDLTGHRLIEALRDRARELSAAITETAAEISSGFPDLNTHPSSAKPWQMDEVTVRFELDLEAEHGIVVSRLKATACFEATIKFRRTTGK